jgi:hypothetical protein
MLGLSFAANAAGQAKHSPNTATAATVNVFHEIILFILHPPYSFGLAKN